MLLGLLSTFQPLLWGQSGIIELLVTDTLILKPREVTLQFRAAAPELEQQLNDDVDYRSRNQLVESLLKESQQQLLNFLNQQKVAFQEAGRGVNLAGARDLAPFYEVSFKSVVALQAFMQLLEKEKLAEGNVSAVTYGFGEREEQQLLERLLKKANAKAAKLAQLAQVKLGAIVAIVEEPSGNPYSTGPTPEYFREEGARYDYNAVPPSDSQRSFTRVFAKSIRVKYAINP